MSETRLEYFFHGPTLVSVNSTADVLALDGLESDPVIKSDNTMSPVPMPSAFSAGHRMTTMEACFADLEEITSKPIALTGMDRVS